MDFASQVVDPAKSRTTSTDQSYCSSHLAVNQTSQELVISSHDELHWCPDMDYQLSCDNMFQSQPKDTSEISFSSNPSEINSITNKNFDIHLAQIDIETFRSEDIERIRQNHSLSASNDTLRIVDSLASLSNHLHLPTDECEAISLDSLDISIDKEINSELIHKCSQSDKTRYKIAMIDTSAHSQLQNSMINSDDLYPNYSNKHSDFQMANDGRVLPLSRNPFAQKDNAKNADNIQSPGSFVRLFIQNKINSNENSFMENTVSNSSHIYDAKNSNDLSKCDNLFENIAVSTDEVDESTGHSLNTVDSNELPLHVLDLSKKLRSLNLNKQLKYGSASMSSNTSFTSTTTSSSTATFDKRRQSHTNPFISMHNEKKTKSAATQFPDIVQDKEVQACFDSDVIREAPVLVYYPNYSLPDLSFLQDVFKHEKSSQQIYLSPVKHEPPKIIPESNVSRRISNQLSSQKKCRPKSYTDYEMLLTQDFSHITDWDSLNLLLPDDFKEFIEKNDLLNSRIKADNSQVNGNINMPQPIKTTLGNNHRILQSVKRRSQPLRQPASKRYSLQEPTFDINSSNRYMHHHVDIPYSDETNSCMTRSQTMPNCRLSQNPWPSNHPPHVTCFQPLHQPYQTNMYHNCCHACCHSTCHSPSFNSSQSSPQKHNFNWDLLSSSSSFKKLLSFLNKLDECSLHSDSSSSTKADSQPEQNIQVKAQHISKSSRNTAPIIAKKPAPNLTNKAEMSKVNSTQQSRRVATSSNNSAPKLNFQSKATSPLTQTNKPYLPNRSKSSATEPTKIILKRPTSLNKTPVSGIPVPKRTSSRSMIPVSNNTQLKEARTKVGRN